MKLNLINLFLFSLLHVVYSNNAETIATKSPQERGMNAVNSPRKIVTNYECRQNQLKQLINVLNRKPPH